MLRVQGTMNTFYLIDEPVGDYGAYAKSLCQDGSDGVLYVLHSQTALAKMRIFNADGSEAEMCGNGLRCFARYILEKHALKEGWIETLHETYRVKYIEDFYGQVGISIYICPVESYGHDSAKALSKASGYPFDFYRVSNPHVVAALQGPLEEEELLDLGRRGQVIFKEGVNVNIYRSLGEGKIYVETYERGVGLTASCGTGMTAASVAYARALDYYNQRIEVYNKGGLVICQVDKDGLDYGVAFTGNATYISKHGATGPSYFHEEARRYQAFHDMCMVKIKAQSL